MRRDRRARVTPWTANVLSVDLAPTLAVRRLDGHVC